ncbi:hypothetical protein GCM10027406_13770 [Leifsonia lichenia]
MTVWTALAYAVDVAESTQLTDTTGVPFVPLGRAIVPDAVTAPFSVEQEVSFVARMIPVPSGMSASASNEAGRALAVDGAP